MKPSWLVIAALLGLGVYLALELLFGPYGFIAYRQLERFRERSVLELNELHRQTEELQRQVRMLTTDAETIRMEARDIGLVGRNEVVLRLENRDPRPRHRYMPGTVPAEMTRVRDNRPLFRSVGFTVFLVALLVPLVGTRATTGHTLSDTRDETA
ncbi:MAG: septum formation initiator family protein [Spirochaetaceae bacterium]|nr:MAG: septum formation initiator family protein [Spirochaetaceae bacterium]